MNWKRSSIFNGAEGSMLEPKTPPAESYQVLLVELLFIEDWIALTSLGESIET